MTASHLLHPALGEIGASASPEGSFAVIAPCDLEEGYTFMVSTVSGLEEDVVPVTVPSGGVREGQMFYSTSRSLLAKTPYSSTHSLYGNSPTAATSSLSSNISEWTPLVPPPSYSENSKWSSGQQWKDHWYDCFRLGFFHGTLWNACCCPLILAAQVLTRLQLNWLGDPEATDRRPPVCWKHPTFQRMVILVICYWCLATLTAPRYVPTVWILDEGLKEANATLPVVYALHRNGVSHILYHSINALFGLYTLFLLTKLRFHVRRRYRIAPCIESPSTTIACDDCCMAFWCGCCTVAQLARQTEERKEDDASCCLAMPPVTHRSPEPPLVPRNAHIV